MPTLMVSGETFVYFILPLMTLVGVLAIGGISSWMIRRDSRRRVVKRYQR